MNITIKTTRFLLPLLLCAASSSVLAQSGVIHFQGRIIAPVCNDAVSPDARAALAGGSAAVMTSSSSDMGRCGGMSSAITRTSVTSREQRSVDNGRSGATGAASAHAQGYTPDTIWTVTYQ